MPPNRRGATPTIAAVGILCLTGFKLRNLGAPQKQFGFGWNFHEMIPQGKS
jgi:hypothetical protein